MNRVHACLFQPLAHLDGFLERVAHRHLIFWATVVQPDASTSTLATFASVTVEQALAGLQQAMRLSELTSRASSASIASSSASDDAVLAELLCGRAVSTCA